MQKYLIITLGLLLILCLTVNSCKQHNSPTQQPLPTATIPFTICATKTPVPLSYGTSIDNCDSGSYINAFGGYWFTINDCAYGGNSYVWPIAGAMGGIFMMYPGIAGCDNYYAAHMTGTVGTGYTFGFIAMATQLTVTAGTQCQGVDLSAYRGLQFWEKIGPGNTWPEYAIIIPYTQDGPISVTCPVSGQICSNCTYAPSCTSMAAACQCTSKTGYNDPWYVLPMPSIWSQVQVPFTAFTMQGTGGTYNPLTYGATPGIKDVKQITWQTAGNTGGRTGNVDFWVDDIILYY